MRKACVIVFTLAIAFILVGCSSPPPPPVAKAPSPTRNSNPQPTSQETALAQLEQNKADMIAQDEYARRIIAEEEAAHRAKELSVMLEYWEKEGQATLEEKAMIRHKSLRPVSQIYDEIAYITNMYGAGHVKVWECEVELARAEYLSRMFNSYAWRYPE